MTLSVLSKEISSLVESNDDDAAKMTKGQKIKYLWKEDTMNFLLQQLRGQSLALSFLLKALDSSSIDQILTIVQSGQPTFQKVRDGAESIRKARPKERYAESIMDMSFDDTQTLYSLNMSDAVDEQEVSDPEPTKSESSMLVGSSTPVDTSNNRLSDIKPSYDAEFNQSYVPA